MKDDNRIISRRNFLRIAGIGTAGVLIDPAKGHISGYGHFDHESYSFLKDRVRFAVISDPHLYDPDLGMVSSTFHETMINDIKLHKYSDDLIKSALSGVVDSRVDFLIIPGDLTKDGELASHIKLASYLKSLKDNGIPSFVVPGNHDINNPNSVAYSDQHPVPAETVTPEKFIEIYHEFGYSQAFDTDPDSLSYVAEPVPGIWLLAIDSCRYMENDEKPVTGGALSQQTLAWIQSVMQQAKQKGNSVVGFMHHAVLENFNYHASLMPEFIIENHSDISHFLARSGIEIIFTGHTHVQNARSRYWDDGSFLLDVQTGSITTYPHPYRIVSISKGLTRVESRHVTIPGDFGGSCFRKFSRSFSEYSAKRYANKFFLFGNLADLFVNAYLAHVSGDERPCQKTLDTIDEFKSSPIFLYREAGKYLSSVWTDFPPADNNFAIIIPGHFRHLSRNILDILNSALRGAL